MKRTLINGLIAGLCLNVLAGCGGGTSETSDTKLLAQTGCASTYCYGYNVTSSSSIQFYVKSAPWADIHYTVNGGTQSNVRMSKVNGNNAYTVTGLKSGDVVRYFFTIGNTSGGATDTAWMSASMSSSTPTPTPTPTTTPPSGYSFCANEGGSCSFSGTHAVAYGSGSTFTYRFREGSVNCNTTTFGDPVPGAAKSCYYNPTVTTPPAGPTPDYIFCGKDDGMCSFSGTRQIAYGASGGPYAYRNATDRIGCNTTNFGDPAPGAHKYCWVAPLSPTPTPTPAPTGWSLAWSDEFNGTSLDTTKWNMEVNGTGYGNNELEYYTNRTQNVSVSGGNLVITARRETYTGPDGTRSYTSGRINSSGKFSRTYGRMEARMKLPVGQGVWPAFWMLGQNIWSVSWPKCGEIDIMEHINTESVVHGTMHWADANGNHAQYGVASGNVDVTQWHVYAVEWDTNAIKWFVDGAQFMEANIQNNINNTGAFHNPFFLIFNLAVGGDWPGAPNGSVAFPQQMLVDYVRVYKK